MTTPLAPSGPPPKVPLTAPPPIEVELATLRWKMLGYLGLVFALYLLRGAVALGVLVIIAGVFASMILYPFVVFPIGLHRRLALPRHRVYTVTDNGREAELPALTREALTQMGFEFVACLEQAPDMSHVSGIVGLYVNRESGDSAQVILLQSRMRFASVCCFNTRFADGGSLETNDSPEKPLYRPPPSVSIENPFPQIRVLSDLYRAHQALVKEQAQRQRIAATRDNVVSAFQEGVERAHTMVAEHTGFRLTAAGDRYVLTWAGAFRQGAVRAWPIPTLRRLSLAEEETRVLKRLGFRLDIGRLEPLTPQTQ